MKRNEILQMVNKIFVEILDNENIDLVEGTTAADVEEWDSLTHIQLIVAIEKGIGIRFTSKEIQSWKNIGEMLDSIESKVQSKYLSGRDAI